MTLFNQRVLNCLEDLEEARPLTKEQRKAIFAKGLKRPFTQVRTHGNEQGFSRKNIYLEFPGKHRIPQGKLKSGLDTVGSLLRKRVANLIRQARSRGKARATGMGVVRSVTPGRWDVRNYFSKNTEFPRSRAELKRW